MKGKLRAINYDCGDLEQITLAEMRTLEAAQIILCDSDEAVSLVQSFSGYGEVILISNLSDRDIMVLLEQCFLEEKAVVLLKSESNGQLDQWLLEHNIEVALYSSSVSLLMKLSAVGVPVTTRGINESFCVFNNGNLSRDLYLAAKSTATIILRSASNMIRMIDFLCTVRGGNEEAGAIVDGVFVKGTLDSFAGLLFERGRVNMSLMVVGKVVNRLSHVEITGARNYVSYASDAF